LQYGQYGEGSDVMVDARGCEPWRCRSIAYRQKLECMVVSVPYDVGPEKAVDSVSVLETGGLLRIVVFAGCTVREYSSGGSCREGTSAVDAELVAVIGYGGAFMLPARDLVARGVGGKAAICRCCCADSISTAVVPASREAASKVLRWWEIGSGDVGP
jgi:hypothetical protein